MSGAEKERMSQLRLLSSAPKNNRKIGSYGETLEAVERWQPESGRGVGRVVRLEHQIHVKQELAAETSGHESNGGVMEIKCIIFIKSLELAINASTCYME